MVYPAAMLELHICFNEGTSEDLVRKLARTIEGWPRVVAVEPKGFAREHNEAEKFLLSLFPGLEPRDEDAWWWPIAVSEITAKGKAQGFDYEHLRRAKGALGFSSVKLPGIPHGPWYWHPWIDQG